MVEPYPCEKYKFVSWDHYSQYMEMLETTNHCIYIYSMIYYIYKYNIIYTHKVQRRDFDYDFM